MRRTWCGVVVSAVLALVVAPTASAGALSCEEVDSVGEALTAVALALDSGVEVGVGSEIESNLADLTLGLAQIAEAEGDEDLANAALDMADAWENQDRDGFTDALADAVAKLAVISATECGD
jgi:hypothetical protein